ncbi:MAG: hypothetical protein Q4C03_04495, partial [bacterium]|nr:hypothetical protein [bacterium]
MRNIKKIVAVVVLVAAIVAAVIFSANIDAAGAGVGQAWNQVTTTVGGWFKGAENKGAATTTPSDTTSATEAETQSEQTSEADDSVDMTPAATTEEPSEETTEAAKKDKGKSGKKKETAIEPTDRWDETGAATSAEVGSQFMAMATVAGETPEQIAQDLTELRKISASTALSKDEKKDEKKVVNSDRVTRKLSALDTQLA